jgi:hypothetical protein
MKFSEWARDKLGPEPHAMQSLAELWEEAYRYRNLLRLSEAKVKDREQWIDRMEAAEIVWNIKDKDKK